MVTDPQTNKQTQPHTNRQDRLQYNVPQLLSVQCKYSLGTLLGNISIENY